ncbi:MAG: M17 family peptidase N-terminal domain-containing protein, partial [Phycisphaerales bacterium]
ACADALDTPGFAGDSGEVLAAGPKHVLLGLGASDAVTPATVRTAAAKLVRALDRRKDKAVLVDLSAGFPRKRAEIEALGRAFGEGLAIANWRVDRFDGAATRRQPRGGTLKVESKDADFRDGMRRGLVMGEAVNTARAIGATPPNICNPAWVAQQARAMARAWGWAAWSPWATAASRRAACSTSPTCRAGARARRAARSSSSSARPSPTTPAATA